MRQATRTQRVSSADDVHHAGSVCQLIAYGLLAPAGPFPLMCLAFMLIGFGLALQNAHCNGFVASSREHASTKMSLLHASYGAHFMSVRGLRIN